MTDPDRCNGTLFHRSIKSSTIGFRKALILPFVSVGPGITPNIIVHLLLKCSVLSNLRTIIIMVETLYSLRLNGLNQSTFYSSPMLLLSHSNGDVDCKGSIKNSFHTCCPSNTSFISLAVGSDISLGALRSLQNVVSLNICFSHWDEGTK